MRIKNNIPALNTNNNLQKNRGRLEKSLEKLSSGYMINRAGDDAAGLAISEKMRSQIRGLNMAGKNIQDGISLIQTAEGALNEVHSLLQRGRELAIQSANDTYTNADRDLIQREFLHIKEGVDEIANNTEFNGIKLLNVNNAVSYKVYKGEDNSTLPNSSLIGNSDNIHNFTNGVNIISGINDELTFRYDSTSYTINITPGLYKGTSQYLYDDINSKLLALGAPLKLSDVYSHWDDTHMRTILASTITGNHQIEVSGNAFNEIFAQETTFNMSGTYEVMGREADFSVGYTVVKDMNDTLNFKVDGINKSIKLTEGSYSRDELVNELNKQFTATNSNITASMSSAFGMNTTSGPGNNHYILTLQHNTSSSMNAIQLISGNALNPLFLRSVEPGDVWNPKSTSSLTTNIDISNGLIIENGQNEWQFSLDSKINKVIKLQPNSYASTEIINLLNDEFEKISAGITAVNENGTLKFVREMNGSSYTIDDFKIIDKISNNFIKLQTGANPGQSQTILLSNATTKAIGIDNIDISTRRNAEKAIFEFDKAISKISSERSKFGSYQNRLEHSYNSVTNTSENLQSAESRIRDTDMAKEMMKFTKDNILFQAAQSMLVQANQQPQSLLQLLH
ncbi:flagellin N-terminal helical domain-containing protein [Lysinibacillus xylanilyticus]|uniref:flagellin N-terminal helical domain-containing protein n=1 Tax=Lysinibacillus xylanilyticus TaxID=582475 RepID=UPI0036D7ACF8